MVNLLNKTLTLNSKIYQIKAFEVWFQSIMGLHTTLEDAIAEISKLEQFDVTENVTRLIRPVAVAIAVDGVTYEVLP